MLDKDSFIATKNYCNELVTMKDKDGNNISQKRYIANGHIDTAKTIIDNVKDILTSMNAFMVQSGGKYRVRCNKAETPSNFVFNEDNITGSWDIQLGSKTNRFNQTKITYFEPENSYQGNIFLVKDATYLAKDNNQVYERELVLPLTCDYARAAYIGRIVMNQSRFQTTVSFNAVQTAMVVEVGDVVKITHPVPGWNNKLFRVMNMTLQPMGDVRIVAVEYDPLVYTTGTIIQYPDFTRQPTYSGGGLVTAQTGDVAAPVGPIAETNLSTAPGGSITNKQISWTKSPDTTVSYYEITINGSTVVSSTNPVYVYATATPNTDTYAIRAVNTLGYKSSAITG